MNIAGEVLMKANLKTKPPKHMRQKGKGKPGQRFSLERLESLCNEYGVDPAKVAIAGLVPELAPDLKDKDRTDLAVKLMEYTYAKRKAVEITGEEGGPVEMIIKWAGEKSSK